eukprot:8913743-Prorocentrum_lima.AAC.1
MLAATKIDTGHAPLHIASQNGHESCVRALLSHASGVEESMLLAKTHGGDAPLMWAAYKGHES